jgi:Flp pilus assembly protein TadG
MKRLLKYYREKKGISLVLIALLLAVLLFFLGMAVDIAYMYFVKNQLQVAADAAALAGAANLTGGIDDGTFATFGQLSARQEAWKFACKNRAGDKTSSNPDARVYLATNSSTDCDIPPSSDLNEVSNTATGDIVVGHWEATCPSGFTCGIGQTCEPAGSGYFCPANYGGTATGLLINALKARPQRTDESRTYGMPKARVFIGQIFRLIGINWGFMSARASAIASGGGLQILGIPLCLPNCGMTTPLTTVAPNTTPGTRFFLVTHDGPPIIAWTAFFDTTSQSNVSDYILGNKQVPPICNQCISTNNGVMNPSVCDIWTMIQSNRADWDVNGTTINGWKVLVPIYDDIFVCPKSHGGCVGDPGYQPNDPFKVVQFAEAIITDAIPSSNKCGGVSTSGGKTGIVIVGTGPGIAGVSSTISCVGCDSPELQSLTGTVKLVK